MNTINYTYRGQVERGNGKPGYDWRECYSETSIDGAVLYPWMTVPECQADAKARHARAVFKPNPRLLGAYHRKPRS